jgi:hypothetical protein
MGRNIILPDTIGGKYLIQHPAWQSNEADIIHNCCEYPLVYENENREFKHEKNDRKKNANVFVQK